jgi:hypothetical protein
MNNRVYVGCALTDAPPEFLEQVEELKWLLRREGYGVMGFLGTVCGTPPDVYRRDIHGCVAQCDLFVAVGDYSSIGLGYELGTAVEKCGTRVLAVAQEGRKISRLLQGVVHPNYIFRRYRQSLREVVAMVKEILPLSSQTGAPLVARTT